MGKKKTELKDQHKSNNLVRIKNELFAGLKQLAEKNNRPITREVATAIAKHLEANGIKVP